MLKTFTFNLFVNLPSLGLQGRKTAPGMSHIKSVAIIGAGPAGAIAVDAFVQEKAFNLIRVFERREKAGGCWFVSAFFSFVHQCVSNSLTGTALQDLRR